MVHHPPAISLQPVDQVVESGATVVFRVEAEGEDALSYEWVHETVLTTPDSSVFTIENVRADDEGPVYCIVKSLYCENISESAFLTVIEEPLGIAPGGNIPEIGIYPNPASNVLNLIYPFREEYAIRIYTVGGQLESEFLNREVLDISHLEPGPYIISIQNSHRTHLFRDWLLITR